MLSLLKLRGFLRREKATAGMEFALLIPAMVSMLLGTMDLGRALVLNRKIVSATNTMADQATRYNELDPEAIAEIERSGELILRPYDADSLGYDLISVEYDEEGALSVNCRRTVNMAPDGRFPGDLEGLGGWREGVVGLSAIYQYRPVYWGIATGAFDLHHFNVARSRMGRAIPCS